MEYQFLGEAVCTKKLGGTITIGGCHQICNEISGRRGKEKKRHLNPKVNTTTKKENAGDIWAGFAPGPINREGDVQNR